MVIKMVHIGNDWDQVLDGEFDKEYYRKLRNFKASNTAVMFW